MKVTVLLDMLRNADPDTEVFIYAGLNEEGRHKFTPDIAFAVTDLPLLPTIQLIPTEQWWSLTPANPKLSMSSKVQE